MTGSPSQKSASGSVPAADLERGAVSFQQIDWLDEHHHAVSALLMQRGFVPLYPQLVQASGSLKSALMLGQAIGLSRTWLQRDRSRNGWFWMSAADWESATGLTAREQESAREALVEACLWEERRTHNPSRLYFRVQLQAVAQALGLGNEPPANAADEIADDKSPTDDWRWDDSAATTLLGEAQMFFKPLADLAGGVMAGLLLSQLLARQRSALRERHIDVQGMFQIQYDMLADQLLMGQKAMRNARDQLRRAGFISEQVRGTGPTARVHVGVNLAAMTACLQVQPTTAMANRVAAARLAKARPDRQRPILATTPRPTIATNRQSSDSALVGQLSLIDATLSQNQGHTLGLSIQDERRVGLDGALLSIAKRAATPPVDNVDALLSVAAPGWCPFVESEGALLWGSYTEIEYRDPPPASVCETPAVDNSQTRRRRFLDGESEQRPGTGNEVLLGRFIVPDGVNKVQAIRVVEAAPMDYRQLLLDELAGHMRSKRKNIDSPLGFLHTITRKAIKGTLVATMANEVARVRQAHAEAARREVQGIRAGRPNSGAPGDSSSAVVTPGLSANAESERAKLRALRSKLASKAARGSAMRIAGTDASGGQHDE